MCIEIRVCLTELIRVLLFRLPFCQSNATRLRTAIQDELRPLVYFAGEFIVFLFAFCVLMCVSGLVWTFKDEHIDRRANVAQGPFRCSQIY